MIAWRLTSRVDAAVFEDKTRVLLWIVGIIPAWALTIALGFTAAKTRRPPPLGATLVTAIAMVVPVLIAVFFHDVPPELDEIRNWIGMGIAVGLTGVVFRLLFSGRSAGPAAHGVVSKLADFAAYPLWWEWVDETRGCTNAWRVAAPHRRANSGRVTLAHDDAVARMEQLRYSEAESLRAFQDRFTGVRLDGRRLAHLVSREWRGPEPRRGIQILDIGGADGLLTRDFVAAIAQVHPGQRVCVHCVEMSSLRLEYQRNVGGHVSECRVIEGQWPAVATLLGKRSYDIVLASHSLYSVLDDSARAETDLMRSVESVLRARGIGVVLLTTNRSGYWHFRCALRERLFPDEAAEDACAESLELLMNARDTRHSAQWSWVVTIDNIIDVEDLVARASREERLGMWLSYVLRKDVRDFSEAHLLEARGLLAEWTVDGAHLPESFLAESRSGGVAIEDCGAAILHKARVCLVQNDADVRA